MDNPEHVAVVRKGIAAIEAWRRKHLNESLNLSNANLSRADLTEANLTEANLMGANLTMAHLTGANLSRANLIRVDLAGSRLIEADFYEADLTEANLTGAYLGIANLSRVNLTKADLIGADLMGANLTMAKLFEANLSRADLTRADLSRADLSFADFTNAKLHMTTLGNCNLAQVKGLETVKQGAPSSIGVDTLIATFRGAGNRLTSELKTFFLNAGVPRELLEALPRILAEVKYCSAFVGYGQPDIGFAEKLVKDLRARGVQCWLYSLDYTPGARTWKEIGQMRRETEKMIVLCSAKSLIREGLLKEVEDQIDEDPDKIVPVSLDNLWKEKGFRVMRGELDLKPFLMERNYADFSDESAYQDSLNKLLKGLKRKSKLGS